MKTENFNVDIFDLTAEVEYEHMPAFPGDRETPAEREGYVILSIKLRGADITDLVSEYEKDKIIDILVGVD